MQCCWTNCGHQFDDTQSLYDHLTEAHVGRKVNNTLNLTCGWLECRMAYTKRDHITSHLRIHVPLKPHLCSVCSRGFKRPQDLKKHEKLHEFSSGSVVVSGASSGGSGEGLGERDRQTDKVASHHQSLAVHHGADATFDKQFDGLAQPIRSQGFSLLPFYCYSLVDPPQYSLGTIKSGSKRPSCDPCTAATAFDELMYCTRKCNFSYHWHREYDAFALLDNICPFIPDSLSSTVQAGPPSITDVKLDNYLSTDISSLIGILVDIETSLHDTPTSTSSLLQQNETACYITSLSDVCPLSILATVAQQPQLEGSSITHSTSSRILHSNSTQKQAARVQSPQEQKQNQRRAIQISELINSEDELDCAVKLLEMQKRGSGGMVSVVGHAAPSREEKRRRYVVILQHLRRVLGDELRKRGVS
ncbi:hypothetical protein BDR26DRAFT_893569 [Obelidium mucronatum]|nr:hypothetical protein BDR26DRAFT_893569 [Obelidium mucronatum]